MPLYEYRCVTCQQDFTMLRSMQRVDDLPACPSCGTSTVERKPSVFAVGRQETIGLQASSSAGGGCCGGACGCGARSA